MSVRPPLRERVARRLRGRGAWRTWLGMGLLMAMLGYALFSIFWRELPRLNLSELLARLSAGDLLLALAVYTFDLALAIAAWVAIMGSLSGLWSPLHHARIYCATAVARRLPGTFWYVLGRVVLYERLGVPRAITALAGGIEFAVQVVGALLVALAAWPLLVGAQSLNPLWLIAPLLVIAALLNPPAVRAIVARLSPQTDATRVRYRHLLGWVALLALTWAVGGLLLFVLASAVHPLPLSALPAMIGIWATTGAAAILLFSFVPFGLGVNELTLATMLSAFMPAGEALFVALLMRAVLTLCELGFGLAGIVAGLPAVIGPPPDDTAARGKNPHQDAEEPEGVFESRPVLPHE